MFLYFFIQKKTLLSCLFHKGKNINKVEDKVMGCSKNRTGGSSMARNIQGLGTIDYKGI